MGADSPSTKMVEMDDILPSRGWSFAEAIRRCADPSLLENWFRAHRAWQDAGYPRLFITLPDHAEGATAQNERTRWLRSLRDQNEFYFSSLKLQVKGFLKAAALVSIGNPDSSLSPDTILSPVTWKYLKIKNTRTSHFIETGKTERDILNVRIFPVLTAPNAVDLLANLSLESIFRSFVIEDPQVVAALRRASIEGLNLSSFRRVPLTSLADYTDALINALAPNDIASRRRHAASRLIASRIVRLAAYLAKGDLSARGTCPSRSIAVVVPAQIWRRGEILVDFTNGDLYRSAEVDGHNDPTLLARGLTLHRTSAIETNLASAIEGEPSKPRKLQPTTVSAETACQDWLKDQIQANPKGKPQRRGSYKEIALEKFPGLAGRGFERAWATATKGTNWAAPGRPRKSPQ
jgi:hypothetical protein